MDPKYVDAHLVIILNQVREDVKVGFYKYSKVLFYGMYCIDINEFSNTENSVCNENATCSDTQGSYWCECNDGFQGDGKICNGIRFISECTVQHNNLIYRY